MINKYGTKITNVILKIREITKENENNKIICFAEWDELLHVVGKIFDELGIRNVYCKGNIYSKNRSIDKFKNQKMVKVMMLSLDNCASGLHLVEATHIIFLHIPKDIHTERQAIARSYRMGQTKNIKVIKFIIRNSIEQDIFLQRLSGKSFDDAPDVKEKKFFGVRYPPHGNICPTILPRARPIHIELSSTREMGDGVSSDEEEIDDYFGWNE